MKRLLLLIVILFSNQFSHAQFLDNLYKDFLKYGTFYVAGKAQNSYQESRKEYFLARPDIDDLYSGDLNILLIMKGKDKEEKYLKILDIF